MASLPAAPEGQKREALNMTEASRRVRQKTSDVDEMSVVDESDDDGEEDDVFDERDPDTTVDDAQDSAAVSPSSSKVRVRRPVPAFTHTSFLRATSSDAFFLSNSHRRNFANLKLGRDILRGTSAKRISQVLGALDVSTLPHLAHLAKDQAVKRAALPTSTSHSQHALALHMQPERLQMLTTQLLHGFHLMLYGIGDCTHIMRGVMEHASKRHGCAGVILQGAAGRAITIDRIMDAIERALSVSLASVQVPTNVAREDRLLTRIQQLFEVLDTRAKAPRAGEPSRLVLGLLGFDHPLFHTTARIHTLIHALAQCERVHIIASVSQMNAGLVLDSNAGTFGFGMAGHAEMTMHMRGRRALRAPWLWHHTTTYIPPISELVLARGASASMPTTTGLAALKLPSAVDLAGGRVRAAPGASVAAAIAQPISESATIQVLQTITSRARSLFSQLAALQLVAQADAGGGADDTMPPRTPYVVLMREALREFIASSDEGVRQLLGEMVDHGVVLVMRGSTTVTNSHAIAVGDELSIPLPMPVLEQVLAQIA